MTENAKQFSSLLNFLVEPLLDTKDFTVEVNDNDNGDGVKISLDVPDDLRGRVIGKGGRIAKSLRSILESASFSKGRVFLDIVD